MCGQFIFYSLFKWFYSGNAELITNSFITLNKNIYIYNSISMFLYISNIKLHTILKNIKISTEYKIKKQLQYFIIHFFIIKKYYIKNFLVSMKLIFKTGKSHFPNKQLIKAMLISFLFYYQITIRIEKVVKNNFVDSQKNA